MDSKKLLIYRRKLILLLLVLLPAVTMAVAADRSRQGGRISQVVEAREGRLSCWAVTIELDQTKFNPNITSEQISVTDSKYGRDLKDMMMWEVDRSGKVLTIRFKPGRGDFGTGNGVNISVHAAAFAHPPAVVGVVTWSIATDPL
jgi:hypothetical protein